MLEIVQVRSRAQRKAFADYVLQLYEDCPYYVPQIYADEYQLLNRAKNPNLSMSEAACWIAYRDGKIVGRICGIVQLKFNAMWDKKTVRFSRFDCIDDGEVARALLDTVTQWGRGKGMDTLTGPWDFSDQGREGLLTSGFDRRSTYVTNYNYPYFEKFLLDYGFEPTSEWVEYEFKIPSAPNPKFQAVAQMVEKRHRLREMADTAPFPTLIKKYGVAFFETVNECYAHLDGFVPVEGEVLQSLLKQFTLIINTRYLSLVVDENDNVVGVAACLADICDLLQCYKGHITLPFALKLMKRIKHPTGLEMAIIAVKKEYQNRGVNAMMLNRILNNIIEDKITAIESNPELVTNTAVSSQWDTIEKKEIKRRKCYTKNI